MWKLGLRGRAIPFWEYINQNFFAVHTERKKEDKEGKIPLEVFEIRRGGGGGWGGAEANSDDRKKYDLFDNYY